MSAETSPTVPPPTGPGPVSRAWRTFRTWPGPARITAYGVLVLVLVLVLGVVVAVNVVRRPLPTTDGAVTLPGLAASVEVLRDENGVPQVYADTSADLMRAQGWVTASERFFQMDVRRHVAAGRLAELFGPQAVDSDRLARTLGWARVGRDELALVEPETRAALAAYAEGVNAYLEQEGPSDLAVEYSLLNLGGLDYRPAPWSETDSLAWLKTVAWELGGGLDVEIDRALTTAAVGEGVVDDLFPDTVVGDPIVGQGAVVDGVFEPEAERGGTRNPLRPPWGPSVGAPSRTSSGTAWAPPNRAGPGVRGEVAGPAGVEVLRRTLAAVEVLPSWVARGAGRGSNAWVVDGEHSATGKPLLANDPHLDVSLPGVWMPVGLHCRTLGPDCPYDVAGSSLPGVPGVVVGHNDRVAWGLTSLGADVTDLAVERVGEASYRSDGESLPLRKRAETIRVAGAPDVEIEVRSTRRGPLLSDLGGAVGRLGVVADQVGSSADLAPSARRDASLGYAVSVRWTGLEPGTTADAILGLDRARTWEAFRAALARWSLPTSGFVYADTGGQVGFQAAGEVPVRKAGNDGSMPVAGWRSTTDWTGRTVPFDGLPRVLDPESGVVVAANQRVADASYPTLLTTSPDPGYRARRIGAVLDAATAAGSAITPAEMVALQGDDLHPLATRLVPVLLGLDLGSGYAAEGQRLLAGWDGTQPPTSSAAAYYNAVWRELLATTFHDELPQDLWPDEDARWVAVVARLLDRPGSPWWDDLGTEGVIESRDDVMRAAMLAARDDLTRRQGFDVDEWTWGRAHTLSLEPDTATLWDSDAVRRLLDRTGPATGGGGTSVEATAWDPAADDPWTITTAPSSRMMVALGDLDASGWVTLGGVSGHPASAHYDDQVAAWSAGELLAWPFGRAAVEAAAEDSLVLEPGGS